jgi:hypothetical protein
MNDRVKVIFQDLIKKKVMGGCKFLYGQAINLALSNLLFFNYDVTEN